MLFRGIDAEVAFSFNLCMPTNSYADFPPRLTCAAQRSFCAIRTMVLVVYRFADHDYSVGRSRSNCLKVV